MAKHRLQRESNVTRTVRGALIAGAVTAGTVAVPAAPAMAATINIPGFGDIAIPDLPQLPPMPQLPAMPQLPGIPPAIGLPQALNTDGSRALDAAKSKVGAQYAWGATGPYAFDCSGLLQWAYKQAGVQIPRTTFEQISTGAPVAKGDLQPGDAVYFDGGGHGAIYAGNGQIVHASTAGQPVKYAPLDSMAFYAARRY